MIVATGYDDNYYDVIVRARDALGLAPADRDRVLERLVLLYPEAVTAVLDNMLVPAPTVPAGYDNEALIVPVGAAT